MSRVQFSPGWVSGCWLAGWGAVSTTLGCCCCCSLAVNSAASLHKYTPSSRLTWTGFSIPMTTCHMYAETTTVLRPLYRSNCVRRHLQLRTGGLCWCKVWLLKCNFIVSQNVVSDEADWEYSGKLLHSSGPAVENERSPMVTSHEGQTLRSL